MCFQTVINMTGRWVLIETVKPQLYERVYLLKSVPSYSDPAGRTRIRTHRRFAVSTVPVHTALALINSLVWS